MDRRLQRALTIGGVALVALLVLAAPALAQTPTDAGTTIKNTIQGIAGPIVFSIGALTALGAFFKRDVGLAFTTLVITIVVGGFVVGSEGIEKFTETLWGNIFQTSGAETCEDGSMPRDGRACPE